MLVNQSTWKDFDKYYRDTYIKVGITGDRLFHVISVSPQEAILSDADDPNTDYAINFTKDGGFFVDYVLPGKNVFQLGNTACLISRVPQRQWKKGMCSANTSFKTLAEGKWKSAGFNIQNIQGFINKPCYYTVEQATAEFGLNTLQAAAITKRVSLSNKGSVFIDDVLVGKFNSLKNVLTTKTLFAPELSPLFPKVTVKVIA